jgi:hypothetical protein
MWQGPGCGCVQQLAPLVTRNDFEILMVLWRYSPAWVRCLEAQHAVFLPEHILHPDRMHTLKRVSENIATQVSLVRLTHRVTHTRSAVKAVCVLAADVTAFVTATWDISGAFIVFTCTEMHFSLNAGEGGRESSRVALGGCDVWKPEVTKISFSSNREYTWIVAERLTFSRSPNHVHLPIRTYKFDIEPVLMLVSLVLRAENTLVPYQTVCLRTRIPLLAYQTFSQMLKDKLWDQAFTVMCC